MTCCNWNRRFDGGVASLLALLLTLLLTATHVHADNATTDVPTGPPSVFDSPYYNDSDSFLSARAAALGASILSGLCGQPLTSAHVYRTVTLLSMCRPAISGKLSPTEVPIGVRIGSAPLAQYYAGAAIINPISFIVVAAFTAFLSLILAKVNGQPWRAAFVTGRYPSHLMFPFFYFLQTSVTCALVVIMEPSAETGIRVACSFCIFFWVALGTAVGVYIYKNVPVKARYVRNFREISADSNKVQLELRRRIAELEAQMLKEEKEAEDRESMLKKQQEEDLASFNLLHGEKSSKETMSDRSSLLGGVGRKLLQGLANTESHLNRLVTKLLPGEDEQQDELARHVRRIEQRRVQASAQERERIRRATNLMYSKMLSSQLSEANHGETALQEAFSGKDRWEDADPDDKSLLLDVSAKDAEDDDIAGALIPAALADYLAQRENTEAKSKTGFLHQWSNLFAKYRERSYCFFVVEVFTSLICGLLEGWKPTSGSSSSCNGPAIALVILFSGYFVTVVVVFPHISKFEGIAMAFIAFIQTVSAVFVLIGIASPDITSSTDWVPITSYVLAVFCIYLLVLKSLSDAITVVSPFFASKEKQWDITDLTEKYFDASRETTNAIESVKAKANELLKAAAAGADDVDSSPSQKQQMMTDAKAAREGISLRMLSETYGDKRQYAMIGGRNNAFVVSRGVPESLHPFVMVPVPGVIPLPVREESAVRRVKKALALKEMAMNLYQRGDSTNSAAAAAAVPQQGDASKATAATPSKTAVGGGTSSGVANSSLASSAASGSASGGTDIIAGAMQYMQVELVKDLAKEQSKALKKLEAERFERGLSQGEAKSSGGETGSSQSKSQPERSSNTSSTRHSTAASVQNDRWFRRDEVEDYDDARRAVKIETISRILTTTSDVFKKVAIQPSSAPAATSRPPQHPPSQQLAAQVTAADLGDDDNGDDDDDDDVVIAPRRPANVSRVLNSTVDVLTRGLGTRQADLSSNSPRPVQRWGTTRSPSQGDTRRRPPQYTDDDDGL